jgi:signal transduction histidine kinase/CheY-like chemotaxis protein
MEDSTLAQLVHALPEPALLLDESGTVLAANPAAAQLTGQPAAALPGALLASLVTEPPETVRRLLDAWTHSTRMTPASLTWRTATGDAPHTLPCEAAALRPDGAPPLILLRCPSRPEPPNHVAALSHQVNALSQEVDDSRRTAEQSRRDESLQAGQVHVLELLATGERLDAVLLALCRTIEQQMPRVLTSILLIDDDGQHLRHGAAPSLPEPYCQAVDGLPLGPCVGSCGTAAFRRQPVIVEDIATDPLWADFRDIARQFGLRACTSLPILGSAGQLLGTVAVYNCRRRWAPDSREQQLVEVTARLAGIAIERRRAEEELRRAKDAAESANRAKDHFLAVLSHELRTPLTPVVAVVSSLEHQPLPPLVLEDLGMIRRCVELETRLIDDLLDLTRVTRGKLELSPHTISAHAKLENVIRLLRSEADSKNLRIAADLAATRHHVRGDSARLQQVFWNLLRNAIKFTPEGGRITVRSWNPDDARIALAITDPGIGIDPAVLPHVFDPFVQGERNVTRQFGGLGLGLAIAKSVIDLHGGQLQADSEGRGRGATFRVLLDTLPAEELNHEDLPAPTAADHPLRQHPVRLLLVEDHPETANVMRRLLTRRGYHVHHADRVATALMLADAEDFDVLVSDIGLPDGSGLDLMRQLRATGHPVAGICLSGFGMPDDVAQSHAAGFAEHLTKPVKLPELEAAIPRLTATLPDPVPAAG